MKFVKEDLENMLREHKKNEAKILEIDIKTSHSTSYNVTPIFYRTAIKP